MSVTLAPVVGVFGAGGFGREVEWLIEQIAPSTDIRFVESATAPGRQVHGRPVVSFAELTGSGQRMPVAVAIGNPQVRAKIVAELDEHGFAPLTLVHPRVEMSRWVEVGPGSIVCAGNILTCDIRLGRHVHINLDCTIGHDAVLDDFATLAPGVHVSGCVHIGKRAYIGTGATIINGTGDRPLIIGDDAKVGAGACVISDVPDGATYVGVPARDKASRPR